MISPAKWSLGAAQVYLFTDSIEFVTLVRQNLSTDVFSSLKTLKSKLSSLSAKPGLCLCVVLDSTAYSLAVGGANLFVVHGGRSYPLVKSLDTPILISGKIKEGDILKVELGGESFEIPVSPSAATHEFLLEKKGIKPKVVELIDSILDRIPQKRLIISEPEGANKSAKKAALAGIIILAVLAGSIYLGLIRQRENLKREEYEPLLAAALHDYEEALEVAGLSQSRARELILKSRDTVRELENKGVEDERLTSLSAGVSEHLGEIAGIYDFAPELFLDLKTVASNFSGDDLAFSGGIVRVLDKNSKRLVGVEVANKRTNIISGSDYLPDALATSAYADRSFILSRDGIREVTGEVELLIKPEWEPSQILISAFAGNFYILDKGANQIWRYQGVQGGFLEKEARLGEGFTIDLSEAASLNIDGSIWTASKNGNFKVYSMGAPATFAITGQTSPFGEVKSVFVSEESKFVYVLDSSNSRICVINKSGQYAGEYTSELISGALDFVVDEQEGLIIFLADSKLYSIAVKHLSQNGGN